MPTNRTLAHIKKTVDEIRKFYPGNDEKPLTQENLDALIESLQKNVQDKEDWIQLLIRRLIEANMDNDILTKQLEQVNLRISQLQDAWNDEAETSKMLIASLDEERARSLDLMRELARREEEIEEARKTMLNLNKWSRQRLGIKTKMSLKSRTWSIKTRSL